MRRFTAFVYTLVIATLISALTFAPFSFSATTGVQIDFLLSQVRNSSGSLAGGSVYFYSAGTTTSKDVYLDINKVAAAANPYTLDANGTALLYGDGTYRIVIKTSAGVTVYDRDNIKIEDLATDLINGEYTMTIKPLNVTGNNAGNIAGYDNITATTRVRAPSIGSASYTDNGYFNNVTIAGTLTGHFRGVLAYNASAQSIPDNTLTTVILDTESYDTDSSHSITTDNTKIFVPSGVTKVRFFGSIQFDQNSNGYREFNLTLGPGYLGLIGAPNRREIAVSGTEGTTFYFATPVIGNITPGEEGYVELRVIQTSGAPLSIPQYKATLEMEIIE